MKKLFQLINKAEYEPVEKLVIQHPEIVNSKSVGLTKSDEGQTPLRVAIKNSFPRMTALFIEYGADINAYTPEDDMYIINQAVYTVMSYARSGRIYLCEREIKEKGTVSEYSQKLYDEDTRLFDLSYFILEYLLKQGIDLSVKTAMGNCFCQGIIQTAPFLKNISCDDVPPEIYRRTKAISSLLVSAKVDTVLPDDVLNEYTDDQQKSIEEWRNKILS